MKVMVQRLVVSVKGVGWYIRRRIVKYSRLVRRGGMGRDCLGEGGVRKNMFKVCSVARKKILLLIKKDIPFNTILSA